MHVAIFHRVSDNVDCVWTRVLVVAALICLASAMASCHAVKTVTVEVPVPIHDTAYISQTVHDSVFVESTATEYLKGDTVFITNTVVKYVERVKKDTVSVFVEKPIEITKVETETVEKPLNWFQRTMIFLGALFLVSLFVGAFLFIVGLKK